MELPFKSLPFLEAVMEQPMLMVAWAAFGVPLLIFLLVLFSKIYRSFKFSFQIDIVIFSSLFFTWIAGFVVMIILLFSGISGIKLYFIWITILVSSFVFSAINHKSIAKYANDAEEKVKRKR